MSVSMQTTAPEVPLLISHEQSDGLLQQVYANTISAARQVLHPADYMEVGMGFGVATDLNKAKVIIAGGALTCVIMVVHMRRGVGALGHFNADTDPREIVGGIQQMVETCNAQSGVGGAAPVSIAISAGFIGVDTFIPRCLSGLRSVFTRSYVQHVAPSDGGVYGSCVYVPLKYRAAFQDQTLRLYGRGDNNLKLYSYDRRIAKIIV